MKRLVVGILAHVDAGKTTLSEAMLFNSGSIKKLGRVDHRDSFLDTHSLERERGITIFSKQAVLQYGDTSLTLLDTPGHVDFSAETERTLQVLDHAVLVVSGTDGLQSHTLTLWKLLQRYRVPCFVFVNKMDLPGADRQELMRLLSVRLSDRCADFSDPEGEEFYERLAECDEDLLEEYSSTDRLDDESIRKAISRRGLIPVLFGSALKDYGVRELLSAIDRFAAAPEADGEFAGKVFKISEDKQGRRLTWLRITGGALRVREVLQSDKNASSEKISQIRIYSGEKFTAVDEAPAGTVCAVTGISFALPGDGVGAEEHSALPVLNPVLSYSLILPQEVNPHTALEALRKLEEEDAQLNVVWNERFGRIQIRVMGEVQMEILKRVIKDRFGFEVGFDAGSIIYKETITSPVEGIGHFEPLRHYAEVHLLLKPAKRNSGLVFRSECKEDLLSKNWQRLILSNLFEASHPGVLTGSPITDMEIILVSGRAHPKHTEGGDFRQAALRAVRQGLRSTESLLLEPFYDFTLEVPADCVGRAMTDIQMMSGRFEQPVTLDDGTVVITGCGPVSEFGSYGRLVAQYTHGKGSLACTFSGYEPCHNADEVIAAFDYDPDRDTDNPCDSVFCSHGAGHIVRWNEVAQYAHLSGTFTPDAPAPVVLERTRAAVRSGGDIFALDKELMQIFERTYGPIKKRRPEQSREIIPGGFTPQKPQRSPKKEPADLTEYLLVDGYNVIYSWDDLKEIAKTNVDAARSRLINILCNYQGYRKCELILVFDAYKVKGHTEEVERFHNISIVYTKEAETADMYIEKTVHRLSGSRRVRVVTSDGMEQLIILGGGALRTPSLSFRDEIRMAEDEIRESMNRT